MVAEPFNLRALVLAIMEESEEASPHALVPLVVSAIDRRDIKEALRQALQGYIGQIVSQERMRHRPSANAKANEEAAAKRTNPSSKVAGYRDFGQRWLRERINVDARGAWKFLGDCTVADLEYIVRARRDLADKNNARAEQYEKLMVELQQYGVATVADLPDTALSALAG